MHRTPLPLITFSLFLLLKFYLGKSWIGLHNESILAERPFLHMILHRTGRRTRHDLASDLAFDIA